MRITGRGQVTIPITIRETLGLLPGTDVDFAIDGSAVRMTRTRKPRKMDGYRVVRALRGRASVAMSTDEILALTRKA